MFCLATGGLLSVQIVDDCFDEFEPVVADILHVLDDGVLLLFRSLFQSHEYFG
jgi:hypothetical protein